MPSRICFEGEFCPSLGFAFAEVGTPSFKKFEEEWKKSKHAMATLCERDGKAVLFLNKVFLGFCAYDTCFGEQYGVVKEENGESVFEGF